MLGEWVSKIEIERYRIFYLWKGLFTPISFLLDAERVNGELRSLTFEGPALWSFRPLRILCLLRLSFYRPLINL